MLPLEGLRIADLSMWWAGPFCTRILGALGAEVIKVEAPQLIDGWRMAYMTPETELAWERSPQWNNNNLNKLGITLDLHQPQGVRLLKELVSISDVLVENYSPRVMGNFGLTYDVLRRVNPTLVMLSMPGFGLTGPWRDFVAYGYSFDQISGISGVTGYQGGGPMGIAGFTDPVVGQWGVIAVLAGLEHRRRTGQGQHIDLGAIESLTTLLGPAIAAYSMNKEAPQRMGNRHPSIAPHGCYPCKGRDRWVVISAGSDQEWQALCNAMGKPELARDPRFATALARHRNQAALDKAIAEWTAQHNHREVMERLQEVGVPAGAVLSGEEFDPDRSGQFEARGFLEAVHRPLVGTHRYPGVALGLTPAAGGPVRHRMPAPAYAEHNDLVFGELLGLSAAERQALEERRVISRTPLGLEQSLRGKRAKAF